MRSSFISIYSFGLHSVLDCCVLCICEIIFPLLIGSGKSYLAKALRDVEVENGGRAPRIHSIDDYFMIEVEKVSGIAF